MLEPVRRRETNVQRDAAGAGRRLAAAPISWGVCEVPGWGAQLPPERVLAEMADLGLTATELGAQGWLSLEDGLLERHGLRLVGGFVPVVPGSDEGVAEAAEQLASAGADVFVAALVQDLAWSEPQPLDGEGWRRAGAHLHAL